jgi:hypothetical protein
LKAAQKERTRNRPTLTEFRPACLPFAHRSAKNWTPGLDPN